MLGFGFATTAIVHMFVSPYVVRMRMVAKDGAKGPNDIPLKFLRAQEKAEAAKNGEAAQNESVENDTADTADKKASESDNTEGKETVDEKVQEEDEEDDDEEEEEEVYDLNNRAVEITSLNLFGREKTVIADLDAIKVTSNALGTANYVTDGGHKMFIHEVSSFRKW